MTGIDSSLGFMVWLINFLADRFGNHAIIKGGMELRLLDCPRYTNDIDYVFIPFASKKDVCTLVLEAFALVPGLSVQHTLNSKCLRCICQYTHFKVQIEINVATECESQELTTASLARQTNQQARIVRGMRFDVSLAHKIAAWNERRLLRDLYDCYYFTEILAVTPHLPTLITRLSRSEVRLGRKTKMVSLSIAELVKLLESELSMLTQKAVETQMKDYFSPEELPGLEKKLRIGVQRLMAFLTNLKSSEE